MIDFIKIKNCEELPFEILDPKGKNITKECQYIKPLPPFWAPKVIYKGLLVVVFEKHKPYAINSYKLQFKGD